MKLLLPLAPLLGEIPGPEEEMSDEEKAKVWRKLFFFLWLFVHIEKNETILFLSDKRSLTTLLFFKMPCSHLGSVSLCIMETSWWKRQNKREGWSTKYSSPPRESFMGGAEHSYYHKIFVTSHPQNRPKTSRAMLNLCHLWDFGERMPFVLYFQ